MISINSVIGPIDGDGNSVQVAIADVASQTTLASPGGVRGQKDLKKNRYFKISEI